ncbi:MAG: nucleotidyl transferase AbiEii/AbiGii toxin family protein [Chloroflexota bacterium]
MKYANAAAFRAALETRLNQEARAGGRPIGRARKFLAFTRLLARLEASAPDAWALKGGFALELRLPSRARATRDVDLDWRAGINDVTEALVAASRIDLGDHFEFAIVRVNPTEAGGGGGVRFRAEALLAGRQFEQLLIDVGLEQTIFAPLEQLDVPDLLGFAGIDAPHFPVVTLEQHVAEKVHAYTRRYGDDRESSRPKDLIDILLMADLGTFDSGRLRSAISRVFVSRATHPVPDALPAPPGAWTPAYKTLAAEVGLDGELGLGFANASRFLDPIFSSQTLSAHWNPASRRWR